MVEGSAVVLKYLVKPNYAIIKVAPLGFCGVSASKVVIYLLLFTEYPWIRQQN